MQCFLVLFALFSLTFCSRPMGAYLIILSGWPPHFDLHTTWAMRQSLGILSIFGTFSFTCPLKFWRLGWESICETYFFSSIPLIFSYFIVSQLLSQGRAKCHCMLLTIMWIITKVHAIAIDLVEWTTIACVTCTRDTSAYDDSTRLLHCFELNYSFCG